jgi:hypothetical protein
MIFIAVDRNNLQQNRLLQLRHPDDWHLHGLLKHQQLSEGKATQSNETRHIAPVRFLMDLWSYIITELDTILPLIAQIIPVS